VKRLLAFLPLAVLVGLAIVFAGWSLKRDPHVLPHALVGKPAPATALATLDGGAPVTTRDGANGPYLVNFFASWCGPCALEHPTLMALKEQGVRVVGVAYKDTPQAADAFIAKRGDPFALKLNDAEGRAGIDFGITGVPETYLVGSDGVIIAKVSAPMTNDDARKLMLKAH
jgi:cytochrome c biogenesis protein CcmG/thiol:disulfide interchange protein DsbE